MKLQFVLLFLVVLAVASCHTGIAQPFMYQHRLASDPRYGRIYRVNLATGREEQFLPDSLRIRNFWPDPNQRWVYIDVKGDFLIVDADNPSIVHRPLGTNRKSRVISARHFLKLQRFYISWIEGPDGGGTTSTATFDDHSFAILDSGLAFIDSKAIVSEDESRVYQLGNDSLGSRFISCFSTVSNSQIDKKPFIAIGPPTERKVAHGGSKGKILISYNLPEDGKTVSANYQVIDLATNNASPPIYVPWKSEGYLSGDAKTIFIEEVSIQLSPSGSRRYRPGNVYVFDEFSGKLKQKFALPPDGVVIVSETYPDRFFYYLATKQNSIGIELQNLITLSTITPYFQIIGSGGFTLNAKGTNFVNNCALNWNGSGRTTTFVSSSELNAFVLANDVAKIGIGEVTLSAADGRISNSLPFYVITAVNWVDTLIAYKHKATEMGWLRSRNDDDCDDDEKPEDGVVKNLDNRLEKVKRELLREDSVKARKELEKFVKKLDRMRKRSEDAERRIRPNQVVITIEGYNLLKPNAEYLIDRLPDRKLKKGSKDKD